MLLWKQIMPFSDCCHVQLWEISVISERRKFFFYRQQCVLIWRRTNSINCYWSMSSLSLYSTMMGNLQSCRAAAWGFVIRPEGRVWPAGTYRLLLSQTQACRDLWGCVCHSLPLSQSPSLSPTGQKQWTDAAALLTDFIFWLKTTVRRPLTQVLLWILFLFILFI